jgi:hypothetical protein
MTQAVLLGVYLLSQAEETINEIGGPTQIITVRKFGMTLVEPNHVQDLEQRTATFNEALTKLVLACPDLSIRNDEFRDLLAGFEKRVMQLREQYLELALIEELNIVQRDPHKSSQPYPITPGGMLVRGSDGKPELIPPEQIESFMALLPAAKKLQATTKKKRETKKRGQPSKSQKLKGRQ